MEQQTPDASAVLGLQPVKHSLQPSSNKSSGLQPEASANFLIVHKII